MKTKKEIVKDWITRYTGVNIPDFGEYILLTNFQKCKTWNFRYIWTLKNQENYLYSLEWDIDKDAKFEISGPNGL